MMCYTVSPSGAVIYHETHSFYGIRLRLLYPLNVLLAQIVP